MEVAFIVISWIDVGIKGWIVSFEIGDSPMVKLRDEPLRTGGQLCDGTIRVIPSFLSPSED